MSDFSDTRFPDGSRRLPVSTVGDLKKALASVPDDLPIKASFGDAVDAVLYNIDWEDAHLYFSETEEGDDD